MNHELVRRCRCCGSENLKSVLDLGHQPLANSYLKEPADLPVFPLEMMVCQACYHSQLSVVVEPDLMFRHYLYVTGTSRTLREHFAGLAEEVLQWIQPQPRRVLDVACNDGTLLEAFRTRGCSVHGVDPAVNLVKLALTKNFAVTEGYWPSVRDAVTGPFDLVTATNVLAHVADPAAFLRAALDCLSPAGAVVIEVPYCRELIRLGEWDTIYHEHLSYFLAGPFLKLVDRLEASVTHARLVPSHGGTLRMALQPGMGGHCPEIQALAQAERKDGFQDMATYHRFAERVEQSCQELQQLVDREAAGCRRVVGYGASAKGNTLLNRCHLALHYIVDDNPLKHGYLTPGKQIPIVPTAQLATEQADLCLVLLAWNFADEILGNVRRLRPGRSDIAVFYVPTVRCMAV